MTKDYYFSFGFSQIITADSQEEAYRKFQKKLDVLACVDDDLLFEMQQDFLKSTEWHIFDIQDSKNK